MTYGKTNPHEMVCSSCGKKAYAQRKNKKGQSSPFKKYCKCENKRVEFKPKICKHSN